MSEFSVLVVLYIMLKQILLVMHCSSAKVTTGINKIIMRVCFCFLLQCMFCKSIIIWKYNLDILVKFQYPYSRSVILSIDELFFLRLLGIYLQLWGNTAKYHLLNIFFSSTVKDVGQLELLCSRKAIACWLDLLFLSRIYVWPCEVSPNKLVLQTS